MRSLLFSLVLVSPAAFGQYSDRWFLPPAKNAPVAKQTSAAIMKAACDGEVTGDTCSKCPETSDGPWKFTSLVVGHFSSPQSEEAYAGASTCFYPGAAGSVALLLGKKDGKWTKHQLVLGFEPNRCVRRTLSSGQEFLICESYEYSQDGNRTYRLMSVLVENGEPKFQELFAALDSTRACREGRAQLAEVNRIEFRDVNGDGLEDISIAVSFGSFEMSGQRLEKCAAAEEDRIQSNGKPGKPFPRPTSMKAYRIDLLFDGKQYTPAPGARITRFRGDR